MKKIFKKYFQNCCLISKEVVSLGQETNYLTTHKNTKMLQLKQTLNDSSQKLLSIIKQAEEDLNNLKSLTDLAEQKEDIIVKVLSEMKLKVLFSHNAVRPNFSEVSLNVRVQSENGRIKPLINKGFDRNGSFRNGDRMIKKAEKLAHEIELKTGVQTHINEFGMQVEQHKIDNPFTFSIEFIIK